MNGFVKAGLATAMVAASAFATVAASAADLNDGWRGSIKDSYQPATQSVSRCYFRGDVGYAMQNGMDIGFFSETTQRDEVIGISSDDTWFGEIGAGCGSGSRGLRGEVMFGYRGKFHTSGEPQLWVPDPLNPQVDDPIHVNLTSYTGMFNLYYDFGNFRGFSPYVGAGIGAAYNVVDDVYFTQNPLLVNRIQGDEKWSLAWSVMAGVGYQISERAILDVGYRYIDVGSAHSGTIDDAGFTNPRVNVDDLGAHEIKIGLRYHFGGRTSYPVPMK